MSSSSTDDSYCNNCSRCPYLQGDDQCPRIDKSLLYISFSNSKNKCPHLRDHEGTDPSTCPYLRALNKCPYLEASTKCPYLREHHLN